MDQDRILLVDYLPKGQTINAEYYSFLLVKLKDILKEKPRGKRSKAVLFLHENAQAHRALATQMNLVYLGFQLLDHQRYSHWTEKSIEGLPFFVLHGGHCCRGDLVGRTIF
jgi:hypothetical protein